MEFEQIEGIMVLTLFLGYLALWRIKKQNVKSHIGNDPEVIYDDKRPTQKFFANLSRVMSITIALLIVLHGAGLGSNFVLYQIVILDTDIVNFIGFILGVFGLILCWRAQQEMGNSWRVGIDRKNKTELVTRGVFRYIRNPTYSGLFLICIGSFLIFPTMSFMLWVIVFFISIEFQVRIEEEFLSEYHGEDYTRYYQVTKRYIPFLY
jgi:protein-S-isoprenylcysteine O-methyltransferase Ste14